MCFDSRRPSPAHSHPDREVRPVQRVSGYLVGPCPFGPTPPWASRAHGSRRIKLAPQPSPGISSHTSRHVRPLGCGYVGHLRPPHESPRALRNQAPTTPLAFPCSSGPRGALPHGVFLTLVARTKAINTSVPQTAELGVHSTLFPLCAHQHLERHDSLQRQNTPPQFISDPSPRLVLASNVGSSGRPLPQL